MVIREAPTYSAGETIEHDGHRYEVAADLGDRLELITLRPAPLRGGGALRIAAGNTTRVAKADLFYGLVCSYRHHGYQPVGRRDEYENEWRRRSNRKCRSRCQCSLHWSRRADLRNAEFIPGMRTQCIFCHKLLGHLASEAYLNAAADIHLGQFLLLKFRVGHELSCFAFEIGMFGVGLRTN